MRIKKPIVKVKKSEEFLSGREIPTLKSMRLEKLRKRKRK